MVISRIIIWKSSEKLKLKDIRLLSKFGPSKIRELWLTRSPNIKLGHILIGECKGRENHIMKHTL